MGCFYFHAGINWTTRSRLFTTFATMGVPFVRRAAVARRTNLLISHLVRGGGGGVEVGESQGEINIDSFYFISALLF